MSNGDIMQKKVIPNPEDILGSSRKIPSPEDILGIKKKDEPLEPSSTQQSGFRTAIEKGQQIDRPGGPENADVFNLEAKPDFDPGVFDYIMEQGAAGSLVAKGVMFLSMLDQGTKLKKDNPFQYASEQMQKMKAAREERFQDYDPSIPENVAASLMSLALDSGPFALAARSSSSATKGVGQAARWAKSKLIKGGMAKEAAEAGAKQAFISTLAERGVQTGLTLGQYGAAQNVVDQLSEANIDDFDTHEALKTFGKDFLIGVPVGVLGTVGGMVGSKVSSKMIDKGVSNFVSKASGGALEYGAFTPAEAAVFEAGGAVADKRKPTVDGWLSSIGVVLGAKVGGKMAQPRASENFKPEKADKGEFSIDLSLDELNRLSAREAKGMTKDEVIDRIMNDKEYRDDVMNNPEVPWVTKAKLEWASNGVEPTETPEVDRYDVKTTADGRASLETRDANDALIQSIQFENKLSAMKAASIIDASMKETEAMSKIQDLDISSFSELDAKVRDTGIEGGIGSEDLQVALSVPKDIRTPDQNKMVDSFMKSYIDFKTSQSVQEPLSPSGQGKVPPEGEKPSETSKKRITAAEAYIEYLPTEELPARKELIDQVISYLDTEAKADLANSEGSIPLKKEGVFTQNSARNLVGEERMNLKSEQDIDALSAELKNSSQALEKEMKGRESMGPQKEGTIRYGSKEYPDIEALKADLRNVEDLGQLPIVMDYKIMKAIDDVKVERAMKASQEREVVRMGPETPKGFTRRNWDKNMKARGLLPKDVFQAWVKTQGALNNEMFEIELTQKNFREAVKEAYGKDFTKAELERINEVLGNLGTGDEQAAMLQQLPEPMRDVVSDMRNQIDALSREMLRMGMIEGDLVGKFDENMGFYLTRKYKAHNDKDWTYDNIPPETMNRAWNFMRKEYPNMSESEIEGELRSMLRDPDMPLGFLKSKKLGSKDLGILKLRKDIPVELRDFLGEYKDPLYNYASSVYRMADLIGREKFLRDVKDMGMGKFLFENKTATHYRPIAAEGSRVMSPLNGLYTTPELAGAFERFQSAQPWSNWFMQSYAKLNSAVKYGKTIASPQTHIRNWESNLLLQMANGRFFTQQGLKSRGDLVKFNYAKSSKKDPLYKDHISRAIELGVLRDNARAGEIFDVIEDAHKSLNDFDKATDSWINKPIKKLNKGVQNLYQLEDDVHKLFAWDVELGRYEDVYKRKYPDKPADEIKVMAEEKAADIVRNTMPTYSLVPEFLKQVRRLPVVGTFISFPAEIMRTTYNVVDISLREMKDPATREIGATRMAGLLTAFAMTYGAKRAMWYKFGLTKEDDDDMRRFRPPWSVNSDALIVSPVKEGKYSEIDMAFSDPLNYIKNAMNAVMNNIDNPNEAWKDGLKELVSPFAEEELLFSKFVDVMRNTVKDTRSPIYNEDLLMGDKIAKTFEYMWDDLQPGFMSSGERMIKGARGVQEGGREYNFKEELIANVLGLRISRRNTGQSFKYHVNDWRERIDQTRFDYIKVLNSSNPSQDKLDRTYESVNAALERIIKEAHEDYLAARRLGVPKKELAKHLNTLSDKKIAGMIITGRFVPINKKVGKW